MVDDGLSVALARLVLHGVVPEHALCGQERGVGLAADGDAALSGAEAHVHTAPPVPGEEVPVDDLALHAVQAVAAVGEAGVAGKAVGAVAWV